MNGLPGIPALQGREDVKSDLRARLADARLYLCTDARRSRGDLPRFLDAVLGAGVDIVQLREKGLEAGEELALLEVFAGACRRHGRLLAVNDRADVALAAGADAVQRTSTSLPVKDIRALVDKRLRIGASVHSLPEALEAEIGGADWLVFGPVYETPSKRSYGPPQGLDALARVARAVTIPVIAIGGVTPERVGELRRAGAGGVAAISAILAADSPADATRRFLDALAAS